MTDYNSLVQMLFAPARAMTAQPPKANLGGGWMEKLHNAIDPVQAFGGYGNLTAMALPPGGPKVVPFPGKWKGTHYPMKTEKRGDFEVYLPVVQRELPPDARISDIPGFGMDRPLRGHEIAADQAANQALRDAASRLRATIKDPVALERATDEIFAASIEPNPQYAIALRLKKLLGPK